MQNNTPMFVLTPNGKERGLVVSVTNRQCHEGCRGRVLAVLWSDGEKTYPCTKGMISVNRKTMRIMGPNE